MCLRPSLLSNRQISVNSFIHKPLASLTNKATTGWYLTIMFRGSNHCTNVGCLAKKPRVLILYSNVHHVDAFDECLTSADPISLYICAV
jgi:hypothetical protein